jgi:hypothetical protein
MAIQRNESDAEQAYRHIKSVHKRLHDYTASTITQISNGCLADKIIEIGRVYRNCLLEFAEFENTPGVIALAHAIEGFDYDVAAEHDAIKTKMVAIQAYIFNTMPKQNGYLLIWQLNTDFTTAIRSFTGVQVAALVTLLQDMVA